MAAVSDAIRDCRFVRPFDKNALGYRHRRTVNLTHP